MASRTVYIVAGLALGIAAGVAVSQIFGFNILAKALEKAFAPKPKVDCLKVRAAEIYGTTIDYDVKVEDAYTGDAVNGAKIYLLKDVTRWIDYPYIWDYVPSLYAGKSAITAVNGTATVPMPTPENETVKKTHRYVVVTAPGYWTELYDLYVELVPLKASSESDCMVYKLVQFIKPSFIDAITGKTFSKTIKLYKVANVSVTGGALGINAEKIGAQYTVTLEFKATDGELRVKEIRIYPGANFDPKAGDYEGVVSIRIDKIEVNGKEVKLPKNFDVTIFSRYDETKALNEKGYAIIRFTGKDILRVEKDKALKITFTIEANTEATATDNDDKLGPGEGVLKVQLVAPDPVNGVIATGYVKG